ncbi:MAG: hypothetical protein PHV82_03180 [Victivallaceae bacterium]|nr:hypothetical protein [Victivallaceae bacterium]
MQGEIVWPVDDLKALETQFMRATSELEMPVENAVKWAAFLVAQSCGAKTKKAPEKRRAYVNRETTGKMNKKAFPYYREVWIDGPKNIRKWYLKEKTDPAYEKISKSGLAKNSWKWMKPWARRKGGSNFAAEVNHRRSGLNIEIEMANKLSYILEAIKESDTNFILGDAMAKAARRMEKLIDQKMAKMAK